MTRQPKAIKHCWDNVGNQPDLEHPMKVLARGVVPFGEQYDPRTPNQRHLLEDAVPSRRGRASTIWCAFTEQAKADSASLGNGDRGIQVGGYLCSKIRADVEPAYLGIAVPP